MALWASSVVHHSTSYTSSIAKLKQLDHVVRASSVMYCCEPPLDFEYEEMSAPIMDKNSADWLSSLSFIVGGSQSIAALSTRPVIRQAEEVLRHVTIHGAAVAAALWVVGTDRCTTNQPQILICITHCQSLWKLWQVHRFGLCMGVGIQCVWLWGQRGC